MTLAVNIAQSGANNVSFRNRIINGNMTIDQRNAGASVTPTNGQYSVDRWQASLSQASKYTVQQNAGSVTPPAGFSNYLGVTSLSAYSLGSSDFFFLRQFIEGFNFADMGFGTANASAVTLSFRVYSSLTGTFGGAVKNSAIDRSYPFSYTISSANTWTTVSVTISGDTTGTWIGATNGTGIAVLFNLGSGSTFLGTAGAWASANYIGATGNISVVGTSGATFYITGVQLEAGTTASPFEYRSFTTEVQLCQRYFCKSSSLNVVATNGTAFGTAGMFSSGAFNAFAINTGYGQWISYPVTMRTEATTFTFINTNVVASPTAGNWAIYNTSTPAWVNGSMSTQSSTATGFGFVATGTWPAGAVMFYGAWTASAEL